MAQPNNSLPQTSPLGAALRGALDSATLGYAPSALGLIDPESGKELQNYNNADIQQHPYARGTGQVVGDVATGIVAPEARGLPLVGRLVEAIYGNHALNGALQGGANVLNSGSPSNDPGDAAWAAMFGSGAGGLTGAAKNRAIQGMGQAVGQLMRDHGDGEAAEEQRIRNGYKQIPGS